MLFFETFANWTLQAEEIFEFLPPLTSLLIQMYFYVDRPICVVHFKQLYDILREVKLTAVSRMLGSLMRRKALRGGARCARKFV